MLVRTLVHAGPPVQPGWLRVFYKRCVEYNSVT